MTGAYNLSPQTSAPPETIGRKAHSLVSMMAAGLSVPEGFVLATDFFKHWLVILSGLPEWSALVHSPDDALPHICDRLKKVCSSLPYDDAQSATIAQALRRHPAIDRFAVRSSSPDEDLSDASFAGAYETRLGVGPAELESAVRRCFSSALDVRPMLYKRKLGMALDDLRMAVIVQRQLLSDSAGVAFSVNPLNNDHDEVLLNANWGQGESVVSGASSPDSFVVRKTNLEIVSRQLGGKEVVLGLDPSGGLRELEGERRDIYCLQDAQARAVAQAAQALEALYEAPVDIEWAFVGDDLFLLQARPITTIQVIPPEIETRAGEPRRIYWDLTMTNHGIFDPLSRLGSSLIEEIVAGGRRELCGDRRLPVPASRLIIVSGGRVYADIVNLVCLAGGDRMAEHLEAMDPLASRTVASLDLATFAAARIRRTRIFAGAMARMPRRTINAVRALRSPRRARARWDVKWNEHLAFLGEVRTRGLPPGAMARRVVGHTMALILREPLILYLTSREAARRIRALFKEPSAETSAQLELLEQFLPNNVTLEMGFALHRLSSLVPEENISDPEGLGRALADGTSSEALRNGWEAFLQAYGHRGLKEIDVAEPRFRERPELLIQQLSTFVKPGTDALTPHRLFERGQERRHTASRALEASVAGKPGQLRRLRRLLNVVEMLGGFRETHKFVEVHMIDFVRRAVLDFAEHLTREGRLDDPQDIFHLQLSDLDEAVVSPEMDLRAQVEHGRRASRAAGMCRNRSAIMDSRGRFYLAPKRAGAAGEIAGHAISSGIVVGRVKVLSSPTEKALHPGEILVARATDPGWTPLFGNAAGIILEIGGALQHGALVAREYGKPCVSGILHATELFSDGEEVEVDGFAGVVRRLKLPPSLSAEPVQG